MKFSVIAVCTAWAAILGMIYDNHQTHKRISRWSELVAYKQNCFDIHLHNLSLNYIKLNKDFTEKPTPDDYKTGYDCEIYTKKAEQYCIDFPQHCNKGE